MPGFDQTGPEGQGPMTGRRMGRCTNYGRNLKQNDSSGEQNEKTTGNTPGRGFGFGLRRSGFGRGRGRGMGRQNRYRGES